MASLGSSPLHTSAPYGRPQTSVALGSPVSAFVSQFLSTPPMTVVMTQTSPRVEPGSQGVTYSYMDLMTSSIPPPTELPTRPVTGASTFSDLADAEYLDEAAKLHLELAQKASDDAAKLKARAATASHTPATESESHSTSEAATTAASAETTAPDPSTTTAMQSSEPQDSPTRSQPASDA